MCLPVYIDVSFGNFDNSIYESLITELFYYQAHTHTSTHTQPFYSSLGQLE